ncbi:MAG: response regulator, partial [Candidatus Aminicenantes bacterium]|nr:response regulator [Candidatus Aminicenantes bacterium]
MEKTRILIVEDEQIIVSSLTYLLGNMGYAVIGSTNTGEKAVEMTERLKPDLVLMDIILKGKMDGIRASEIIHSRFQIPIVYLTAYMDKKLLKRVKVSEPFGYILKPFKENELQVAIEIAILRHTMEEKLKHILDEWKSTFDAVQDSIMLLDKHFIIKHANRATAVFLDKPSKEIIGKNCYELFHKEKIPRYCPLNKMRKTLRHEEAVIFLADRKKWILVSVDPILDEEGELKEAVHVLRDITRSKRAEKALEDSRRKLQELNQYLESVREKERTGIAR